MTDDSKRERDQEEVIGEIKEAAKEIEREARQIRKKASDSLTGGAGYQSSGGDDVIPPGDRDTEDE